MPDSCLLRRFLNLRKSSSNLPLKVGDVKPVSTGNFFGNSTWRKLGVNLALFFLKNGLKIPHKTGWHKTVETKKCLQYQHFSHVTRQNQMFYPALVMRRSPVRVRSLAPENRRFYEKAAVFLCKKFRSSFGHRFYPVIFPPITNSTRTAAKLCPNFYAFSLSSLGFGIRISSSISDGRACASFTRETSSLS